VRERLQKRLSVRSAKSADDGQTSLAAPFGVRGCAEGLVTVSHVALCFFSAEETPTTDALSDLRFDLRPITRAPGAL
jgi:hypothetical protein